MNKTKKKSIKSKKYAHFGLKLEKLTSNSMMNTTKIGKTLKSENFMIIFTKIWTEKRKLS